jgi:hypothetical protein
MPFMQEIKIIFERVLCLFDKKQSGIVLYFARLFRYINIVNYRRPLITPREELRMKLST